MIIYAESNLVLELALDQEQADAARRIVELAEAGRVALVLPAVALSEPFSNLAYRQRERRRIIGEIQRERAQLQRSAMHRHLAVALAEISDRWDSLANVEDVALNVVAARLFRTAGLLPIDSHVFEAGLEYQVKYELRPQDAIIYASIVADLSGSAKENSQDRSQPELLGPDSCLP
ncbi:MAG TPA: hypothetical protein VG406_06265 [Isosphaeraceae bacterium]|jgi:predicted nucleic acid-binding protein|nr:hypothetical protein [Isosphaeraceae bacterium]